MSPAEWTAFGIAICVMLVGVLGTIVPLLPGLPLIWLTMLIYAIVEGFKRVDARVPWPHIGCADRSGGGRLPWTRLGDRRFGASKAGALGAVLGSLVGLFFCPWDSSWGRSSASSSPNCFQDGRHPNPSAQAGAGSSARWVPWPSSSPWRWG